MSTPDDDPPSSRRGGIIAVAVIGTALLAVLLVVQWAGRERADPASLSFGDVEAAIRAGGLVVCSSRPVDDPSGAGALEARALEVGSSDAGEISAEGQNGEGGQTCAPRAVAGVVMTRFADVDARDAAARSVEGVVRPRGSAALYTAGDLTLLVDGSSEDAPRERLESVLAGLDAR